MDTQSQLLLERSKNITQELIVAARHQDLELIKATRKNGEYARIDTSGDSYIVFNLKLLLETLNAIK